MTAMEKANKLFTDALDALVRDSKKAVELFKQAGDAYLQAGSPADKQVCDFMAKDVESHKGRAQ